MKAITVRQPWATLIASGAKRYETRCWAPRNPKGGQFTGQVAIHAAKLLSPRQRDLCGREPYWSALRASGVVSLAELPLGRIVAVCELGIARPGPAVLPHLHGDDDQALFGDFTSRCLAWPLVSVVPIPDGEPVLGQLGLWDLPTPVAARLLGELRKRRTPARRKR